MECLLGGLCSPYRGIGEHINHFPNRDGTGLDRKGFEMSKFQGRRKRSTAAPDAAPDAAPEPVLQGDVLGPSALQGDIPAHVWQSLQDAGELAAARLVEVLRSPAFKSYAPSAQRGLIELALTRAYGLPIRRALNLNLSSNDADAVAASLDDLRAALPEFGAPEASGGRRKAH